MTLVLAGTGAPNTILVRVYERRYAGAHGGSTSMPSSLVSSCYFECIIYGRAIKTNKK